MNFGTGLRPLAMFGFLNSKTENSKPSCKIISWPYSPHFSASERSGRQKALTEAAHSLLAKQILDKTLKAVNQSSLSDLVGQKPKPDSNTSQT